MDPNSQSHTHGRRKKVLHFSDGVEEFSESDDEVDGPETAATSDEANQAGESIDEVSDGLIREYRDSPDPLLHFQSTMEWGPWLLLKSKRTGETILSGCDYVGEFLASALGITSPKFIDGEEELRKAEAEQKERDEEAAEEEREMSTWKVNLEQQAATIMAPQSAPPVLIMKDEAEKPERY